MINNVVMTGRLTRDIELKYSQSGVAVANFTLAVDRSFKSANGERETDFVNCVVFRKTAEDATNFVGKGSLVGIEGRIQTRNYEKDGRRVYVTEVVVDKLTYLESKNSRNAEETNQQNTSNYGSNSNAQGGRNTGYTKTADPFTKTGSPIDVSDEDLPFD